MNIAGSQIPKNKIPSKTRILDLYTTGEIGTDRIGKGFPNQYSTDFSLLLNTIQAVFYDLPDHCCRWRVMIVFSKFLKLLITNRRQTDCTANGITLGRIVELRSATLENFFLRIFLHTAPLHSWKISFLTYLYHGLIYCQGLFLIGLNILLIL